MAKLAKELERFENDGSLISAINYSAMENYSNQWLHGEL